MFQIARYQIKEQIGAGSMGVVYRGVDRLTGQTIALKLVGNTERRDSYQTPIHDTEEHWLALAQEFRTLSSLHHPYIIGVLDYGFSNEQQPYFTMEYLQDAQNLIQAAQSQPLVMQARLIRQVLQALAYLHRRGILHRDLKPNNILVQGGQARVLDFGLSVSFDAAQGRAGTLAYMAPEVLQRGVAEVASDLYSVGVMAYQIFSGQLPFANNDINAILMREPDLSLIQGPAELKQFVGKLLEKDPARRYSHASAAITALARAVSLSLPLGEIDTRESYLQAAQFVGRENEIGQLLAALQNAREGRGSLWLVGGESGVGKTRLFDELRTRALVNGATVVRGQAIAESSSPYQIWQEPLRQLALITPLSDLQAGVLTSIIPDLAKLLNTDIPPAVGMEGADARQRLVLTLVDVMRTAATANAPLVIILEDLQWALAGLEPLKVLGRIVHDAPILIIANYRNDEVPQIAEEVSDAHRMTLSRLDANQIAHLSGFVLGESGNRPEVIEWLVRETEGNIFFLIETLRTLVEEQGMLEVDGRLNLPDSVLTRGMQELMQHRIDRMPSTGRPLLDLAAIAGRAFDLPLLSKLAPTIDLSSWLIDGANVSLFEELDGRWQFAHDKIRETLISNLEPDARPQLYRTVAEVCEQLYQDDASHAAALSAWWRAANDPLKEVQSAQLAADYAISQESYVQAEGFVLRALELIPGDEFSARYELLLKLEKIHIELERHAELNADIERLEALADHLNLSQRYQIMLHRAHYEQITQNYSGAVEIFETLNQMAEEYLDEKSRIRMEKLWGTILLHQSVYDSALRHFERGLALSQKVGDKSEEANILIRMSVIYFDLGEVVNVRLDERALELYREVGNKKGEGMALTNYGNRLDEKGDREQALDCYHEALRLFQQAGYQLGEAITLTNLGYLQERLGNYDEAFGLNLRALEIMRKVGAREWEVGTLTFLASVDFSLRKYSEARDYALQATRLGEALGGNRMDIVAWVLLGHINISLKQLEDADEALKTAQKICHQTGYTRVMADLWDGFARLALARRDKGRALKAVEQILLLGETDPSLTSVSDEPMRVFSTCYSILEMHKDPRSIVTLQTAHTQLERFAAKLIDPKLKKTFMEQVPANREIVALWRGQNSSR